MHLSYIKIIGASMSEPHISELNCDFYIIIFTVWHTLFRDTVVLCVCVVVFLFVFFLGGGGGWGFIITTLLPFFSPVYTFPPGFPSLLQIITFIFLSHSLSP